MSPGGSAFPGRGGTPRVKICGITTPHDATMAIEAGADAIGVVSAHGSRRAVGAEVAHEIARAAAGRVPCILVVRDAAEGDPLVESWMGPVQFHGHEDESTLHAQSTRRPERMHIKAFAADAEALSRWDRCPDACALLADAAQPGSGTRPDWQALAATRAHLTKPLILAGGLTPECVGEAIRLVRPDAVDVSSGVESAPGVKDPARVREFIAAVRRSL